MSLTKKQTKVTIAQSIVAVQYTDCISAER